MAIISTYPLQVVTEEEQEIWDKFKSKTGKYQLKRTLFELIKEYNER